MRCSTCGGELDSSGTCGACTTLLHARPVAIPGFRTLSLLGHGGMGAVWLGEDIALERKVAIKVISERDGDPDSQTRFIREARALASVDHPNVIRVHTYGVVDQKPYFVMEYVDGRNLGERLAEERRVPVREALRITLEVVDALEAAWEKRIVHRDIKPANILLDRRGRVRVADFGLAKPVASAEETAESSVTRTGSILGTPHYIAPEQAQGLGVEFRSDIYSLGIVLYEMLAGQRPFRGTTPLSIISKHLHEPLPDVRLVRDDVSDDVSALIEWMTRKDPAARPASYEALRERIRAIDVPEGPARTRPAPRARAAGGHVGRLAVAALLLLAVIASGSWVLARSARGPADPSEGASPGSPLSIAVAPFYGPDDVSAREGRVMAALAERSIRGRLPKVRVLGIEETKEAVRTHAEARALGKKIGASIVVWGESFVLGAESEVKPFFTLVDVKAPARDGSRAQQGIRTADAGLLEQESQPVRVATTAPNQIEMRRVSADEVGGVVTFLAGLHALYSRDDPEAALALFAQAPRSAAVLRETAKAQLAANRVDDAIATWQELLAMQPGDGPTRAELADALVLKRRLREAFAALAATDVHGRYAIIHQGRLFACEFYEYEKQPFFSDFLIVADERGHVSERYPMPGEITRFTSDGAALRVALSLRSSEIWRGEIVYRNGRFDQPLHPTPDYLLRMRQMKSGIAPADNFLGNVSGMINFQPAKAAFRASEDPVEGKPSSLPEMEAWLRQAITEDPTQPWHLWLLGHTLRAQGKRAEAEAVWNELQAREYPGNPYFTYTWMARWDQRLDEHEWAFRRIAKARALRDRMPQPPFTATLIDRMVNEAFQRVHPLQEMPPETRWRYLVEARTFTGPAEGDHLAAALWARHFEKSGKADLARREREFYREAVRSPFNMAARTVGVDYLVDVAVGLGAAFVLLLLMIIGRAWRRTEPDLAPLFSAGDESGLRLARAVLMALAVAAIFVTLWACVNLWAGAAAWESKEPLVALGLLALLAGTALALVPWVRGRSWLHLLRTVSSREVAALGAVFLFFLLSSLALNAAMNRVIAGGRLDLAVGDSLGHAAIVEHATDLAKSRGTPAAIEVAAAANHLAERWTTAARLYGQLGQTERSREALARIARNDPRAVMPPPKIVFEGLTDGALSFAPPSPTTELEGIGPFSMMIAWGEGALLFVALLAGSGFVAARLRLPSSAAKDEAETPVSRWLALLLPGAFLPCSP